MLFNILYYYIFIMPYALHVYIHAYQHIYK